MKSFLLLAVIFCFHKPINPNSEPVTPDVHERIAILKQQIKDEINSHKHSISRNRDQQYRPIDKADDFGENYEYVEPDDKPITPIMDFDERKQRDMYKFKKIKTTTTMRSETKDVMRSHHRVKKSKAMKPRDIFYRRQFENNQLNMNMQWTHCQDLITPFLDGHKTDMTVTKRVLAKDKVVTRLIHLLSVNTTGQTKDDIYSVIYQISNLQIRMFQWDVTAMRLLINFITKDSKRRFKAMKHGIKAIFNKWHLDIGNITNLLKQSRIFRPPCIGMNNYDGSTKVPKLPRPYTKPTTKKK